MPLESDFLGHAGLILAAFFAVEFALQRILARSIRRKIQSSERIFAGQSAVAANKANSLGDKFPKY